LTLPVQDILRRCESALLSHARFDPTESQDVFRIAMDVSAQINVLPALVERVHSQAPGVSILAKLPRPADLIRDLELGEVDFAITAGVPVPTAGTRAELLMTTQHVSILRKNHPRATSRLSLKKFLDLDHVAVHRPGVVDLAIDALLAERSLERRIVVTVETPVAIPALISRSDLVATLPRMVCAKSDPRAMSLIAFKPPLELPAIQVFLVSHEQTHNSAAHRWMRASILSAFETLA
jgi:DNA-binding transcriptional LysR family regulator